MIKVGIVGFKDIPERIIDFIENPGVKLSVIAGRALQKSGIECFYPKYEYLKFEMRT
jgi:hypothetical protein